MSKVFFCLVILSFSACCSRKIDTVDKNSDSTVVKALPSIIIYKTKANYSNYVPVGLSSDKKEIISYPHPKDVITDNGFRLPTELKNGYWMDQIGVGINSAYLKISIAEYSNLKEPLSLAKMKKMIIDIDPFIEMWNCGIKGSLTAEELNLKIMSGNLDSSFSKIR